MRNVLTIDVEEYFHPAEVQLSVPPQRWSELPSRLDEEIQLVLDLLDARGVKATFFVLGWVAERCPRPIRKIVAAGHEVGCHSYAHQLVYQLTPQEFRRDTERAMKAIADCCGVEPRLYRAPSYSITRESFWALEVLVQLGFTHDSSIYPIAHDRYGIPGFQRHAHTISTPSGPIREIPIASFRDSRERAVPVGGGGYLRLLPYCYTAAGIRRVNRDEQKPVCIYFHPWELDPPQPRLATGFVSRLRTYTGLKGMTGKLERLLRDFEFSTMTDVYQGYSGAPAPLSAAAITG
jgi:polysaccharide deacetylase family protein (PEP-CTERM system associated)